MFRSSRVFLHCFALALFGLPGLGHAYSACVGTSAELDAATSDASATADASISIRIREGTYVAGSGISFRVSLTHSNQTVNISGGWSGATCQDRRYGAGSGTVLFGSPEVSALYLDAGIGTSANTINATDLTLRNDVGTLNETVGGCLRVVANGGSTFRIHRLLLDGCVGAAAAKFDNFSSDILFANSVVKGGFTSGAPVQLYTNNATTRLAYLTISGNTATSSSQEASGLYIHSDPNPPSQVTLDNSVVWGGLAPQGIPDIATNGAGIVFTRAHYETRSNVNAAITDNMPSHGDPGFLTPTKPRLRADSQLVDSGVTLGVGGTLDADGNIRVRGPAVDVGAYEFDADVIHADGFDH